MPWKRIGKIIGAIVIGGGVGSGVPQDGVNIPPEMLETINTFLGALIALAALFIKPPKDTKE